jgi:hypothetical protein
MTTSEYIKLALRTEAPATFLASGNEQHARILHALLLLVTETLELELALVDGDYVNTREELGDIFWALALLGVASGRGKDYLDYVRVGYAASTGPAAPNFGALERPLSHIKAVIIYGRALDVGMLADVASYSFSIGRVICVNKFDLPSIAEANLRKLLVRFPDKFTNENANSRDLESERKAIQ